LAKYRLSGWDAMGLVGIIGAAMSWLLMAAMSWLLTGTLSPLVVLMLGGYVLMLGGYAMSVVFEWFVASRRPSKKASPVLALPSVVRCQGCTELVPADAKYCLRCGRQMDANCTSCGKLIPSIGSFCPNCGVAATTN